MGHPQKWSDSLEALKAVMPRCQTLEIEDAGWDCLNKLISSPSTESLPPLQSIILRTPTAVDIDLANVRHLRQLFVKGSRSLTLTSKFDSARFSEDGNIRDSFASLQSCLLLRQLKCQPFVTDRLDNQTDIHPLHFPNFRQLSFMGHLETSSNHHLSSWIIADQLQYFQVDDWTSLRVIPHFPSIQTLDLRGRSNDDLLIEMVRHHSNLRELILPSVRSCSILLASALCQREESGGFRIAPQLREPWGAFRSVKLVENLMEARNGGRAEGPAMPFILHLRYRATSPPLKDFQHRFPWSIVLKEYRDLFDARTWRLNDFHDKNGTD